MNAVLKSSQDFHIADITLAAWGNKEIKIAETEMPGLTLWLPRVLGMVT